MKVTIDLENLESLVQNTMETNIENIGKEQIEGTVRKVADNLAKKIIEEKVSENFQRLSYTVVGGDTLWGISKQKYGNGSSYPKIYNANNGTIEASAKKHGKSSSDNGHWIYPGDVYTIPA